MLRLRSGSSESCARLYKIRLDPGSNLSYLNDLLLGKITGLKNDLRTDSRLTGDGDHLPHFLLDIIVVMLFHFAYIENIVELLTPVSDCIPCLGDLGRNRCLAKRKADGGTGQHIGSAQHFTAHSHRICIDRDGLEAVMYGLIAQLLKIFPCRIRFQIRMVDHCGDLFYSNHEFSLLISCFAIN